MSQSEETTVTAQPGVKETPTNGQGLTTGQKRSEECKISYQGLQTAIGYHIAQIDATLRKFYQENGNQYYLEPSEEVPRTELFKWNIVKKGDSNVVEVFFKAKASVSDSEQSTSKATQQGTQQATQQGTQQTAQQATNGAMLNQAGAGQTGQSQQAEIFTYTEVGAPPSGPTPAKPSNP